MTHASAELMTQRHLQVMIADAVKAEREACAKVADQIAASEKLGDSRWDDSARFYRFGAEDAAYAIRART